MLLLTFTPVPRHTRWTTTADITIFKLYIFTNSSVADLIIITLWYWNCNFKLASFSESIMNLWVHENLQYQASKKKEQLTCTQVLFYVEFDNHYNLKERTIHNTLTFTMFSSPKESTVTLCEVCLNNSAICVRPAEFMHITGSSVASSASIIFQHNYMKKYVSVNFFSIT